MQLNNTLHACLDLLQKQELASKKTLHDAPLGDLTENMTRIRDIHVDELQRVVNDMVVHIDLLKALTLTKQAVRYTDEKVDALARGHGLIQESKDISKVLSSFFGGGSTK